MLRVADVLSESVCDGLGLRSVVFMQGCPRHCKGCQNEALIPFEGGTPYTAEGLAARILSYLTPLHKGVTFSGGDPLAQAEELLPVVQMLRREKPEINIWFYTGYLFEEVKDYPIMKEIDVLVDGPFILAQRDISLAFRGSPNQRVIDVRKTLASGEVVLLLE